MIRLTDDELIELFDKQLPDLLERRPELEPRVYHAFMKFFATKEEVAVVLAELRDFRAEVEQRFDRVEQRLDGVEEQAQNFRAEVQERFTNLEERMESGFQRLTLQDQRLEERMESGFQRLTLQDQRLEERMESGFREVHQAIDNLRAQDQRLEERMESGFREVHQAIDNLRAQDQRLEERMESGFREVHQAIDNLRAQDQRLEERMESGFREMQHTIDRLGSRWGIRNESIFRQTMAELLEKSFGFHVEERAIHGEQFDCVISDGQHILVEISASVGPDIKDRLERKRRLYTEATGIAPARIILVTASIHSRRAQSLREAGFDVIEPEEDTLVG
jgi:hypothetical protein